MSFCVSGLAGFFVRLAQGSEGRRSGTQPSDTGGDTQPYFSWVFTRDLKVASASLRLNAFLDFPDFLQIRPCEEETDTERKEGRDEVRIVVKLSNGAIKS